VLNLRWRLLAIKDTERVSLLAIDIDERKTEEIAVASVSGLGAMRNSLLTEWVPNKNLKLMTIANPLKDSMKSKVVTIKISLND